jgi:hypothetical protein
MRAAQRERGIPARLLQSIGRVESGRRDPVTGRPVAPDGNPHASIDMGDGAGAGGYDRRERSALDKLLDEQEKRSPSTPI